jgi:uncharacterized coiled-coil DUF342 family protein
MAFNLKNKDIQLLERIEKELSILCQYNLWTTSEEQETVDNISACREELQTLLNQINEKLDKDRARTYAYIQEKRKTNPEYGRSAYERSLIQKKKDKMS